MVKLSKPILIKLLKIVSKHMFLQKMYFSKLRLKTDIQKKVKELFVVKKIDGGTWFKGRAKNVMDVYYLNEKKNFYWQIGDSQPVNLKPEKIYFVISHDPVTLTF